MHTKLELMNNIYYDKPYNSAHFFELCYCQQFTNVPWEFPEGRHMEFYAKAKNDYFMIFTTSRVTLADNTQTYTLNDFELLIWKPDGKQRITHYPHDKSSYYIFIFSGKCSEEILSSLNLKCNNIYTLTKKHVLPDFRKQISYISHELNSKEEKKYSSNIATSMFMEFLGLYSRNILTSQESENANIIKNITRFIDTNCTHKFDIDKIIKDTHLSRSTFYTLFKKHTGMSILQYINDKRLSIAADYMTILKYSVTEAAMVVGFDDPMYFGRLFKRKFKMTPTEYKKHYNDHNYIINS